MNRFIASVAMAALMAGPTAAQDAAPGTAAIAAQPAQAAASTVQAADATEWVEGQVPSQAASSVDVSSVAAEAAQVATSAADSDVFQVVRPGDGRMTCEALLAEANALNAQANAMQNAMGQRTVAFSQAQMRDMRVSHGASTAMNLGSMAAGFIPGAALAVGAAQSVANVARQGAAAVQQERRMNQMETMMAEAQADAERMMPIMNRADHLTDLAMDRGC